MDNLLLSRLKPHPSPTKLSNLSPQKYGKAAWAQLTYTPSKLSDNIIYRQAVTLRKGEQGNNKLRQFQTLNSFMKERLTQIQIQRDGIQHSLSQQIMMYKKMVYDSQTNHQLRLKEIQKRFNNQISILIGQKEELAKYSQAQKEILQGRIQELEEDVKREERKVADLGGEVEYYKKELQKLTAEYNLLIEKLKENQREKKVNEEDGKKKLDEARRKLEDTERRWEEKIRDVITQKTKQKEGVERSLRAELQRAENIRLSEGVRRSQQIRQIMQSFECQTKRLNEIINMKDRMLQALASDNTKAKDTLLDLTRTYDSRIHLLTNDLSHLHQQNTSLSSQISVLQTQLQQQISSNKTQQSHLQLSITQLKQQLHTNQVGWVRQRDRFQYWSTDVQKQNLQLRSQNIKLMQLIDQNERLGNELRKLRDLLVQSSFQIERSKEELLRVVFERDGLIGRLERIGQEERMGRMRRECEEEGKWRGNGFSGRNGYR